MRLYHAKAGQTLAQIALETGFTYTALKEANPSLHTAAFHHEQTILLPQAKRHATKEASETIPAFCQRLHLGERTLYQLNPSISPRSKKIVVDAGCESRCSIITCGCGMPNFYGSSLKNSFSHLTYYEVYQMQEKRDGYAVPKANRFIATLKEYGVVPLLHFPLKFHLDVTNKLCQDILQSGFSGVVLHPSHFGTQALPFIRTCLKELQDASLITCLALPFCDVSQVRFLLSQFEGLAHYFFLELPPTCDVLAIIEDLTDTTSQRQRFHILLGCQDVKKSHVLQYGFLDTLLATFERISYGRFAGIHFPFWEMPQEFYTCLTGTFHLQEGYQTEPPHSPM